MSDNEQLLDGYWFLKSLFFGSKLGYMVIRKTKSFKFGGVTGLARLHKSIPYFGIGAKGFFSAEFFVIGFITKRMNVNYMKKGKFCQLELYLLRWVCNIINPLC